MGMERNGIEIFKRVLSDWEFVIGFGGELRFPLTLA